MNTFEQDLKKLAKRTKIKRVLLTVFITVITVPIFLGIIYKATQILAAGQHRALDETFQVLEVTNSPNIHTDTRYIANTNIWGGNLISDRYKNIDGYSVPWSQKIGSYTWNRHQLMMGNDSLTSIQRQEKTIALIHRETRDKIPVFYNRNVQQPTIEQRNEAALLQDLPGHLAETALTFKQEYSYQEILQLIPDNILINWYWIGTNSDYDLTGYEHSYLGINADQQTGKLTNSEYKYFVKQLKKLNQIGNVETTDINGKVYSFYEDGVKSLAGAENLQQAKFSGLIVSGTTEALSELSSADWIYASSVGVTVEKLPYLKATK